MWREFITALGGLMAGLPLSLRAQRLAKVVCIRLLDTGSSVGYPSRVIIAMAIFATCFLALPAAAQKQGGTLRVYISANPSSLSILEEVSFTTVSPTLFPVVKQYPVTRLP